MASAIPTAWNAALHRSAVPACRHREDPGPARGRGRGQRPRRSPPPPRRCGRSRHRAHRPPAEHLADDATCVVAPARSAPTTPSWPRRRAVRAVVHRSDALPRSWAACAPSPVRAPTARRPPPRAGRRLTEWAWTPRTRSAHLKARHQRPAREGESSWPRPTRATASFQKYDPEVPSSQRRARPPRQIRLDGRDLRLLRDLRRQGRPGGTLVIAADSPARWSSPGASATCRR